MKKFLLTVVLAGLFAINLAAAEQSTGAEKETVQEESVCSKILWYLPNRVMDFLDCFTVEVSAGDAALQLYLTRYATFGGSVGQPVVGSWSYNRHYGFYTERCWRTDLFQYHAHEIWRKPVWGNFSEQREIIKGIVDIQKMEDAGMEDPYAIGVKGGCIISLKFQIHPVELADFFAGLAGYDFKDDDKCKIF